MAKKVKKVRQVIVDTNILSLKFLDRNPQIDSLLRDEIGWENLFVPSIVAMELYQGVKKDKKLFEELVIFIKGLNVLPVTEAISNLALEIAQKYQLSKVVPVRDNIIACFALHYNLELLTNNTSDVKHITGLKLYPFTYSKTKA